MGRHIHLGLKAQANALSRLLAATASPLWRNTRSVFLLSTGRTGTDTLRHLLSLCPEVMAFHEPHPQLLLERKQARVEIHSDPQKYRRIFSRARGISLLSAFVKNRIYVETSARLTFFAPVIADLLPRSRFIYVHRHPGEIVRSGMRRRWYVDHPANFARITPTPREVGVEEWRSWEPFQKICWYWDAYNRFSLDFENSIDASRVLRLDAKNIFDGSAARLVYHFANVRVPKASAIERELSYRHNAQHLADFPRYDLWTDEMKATLFHIAGDTMRELGYEDEFANAHNE